MERIALIIGTNVIYWRPLLITAAAVTAMLLFVSIYTAKGGTLFSAALAIPMSLAAGTALARFVHWYCRFDNYPDLYTAMTDYSTGGYALVGVFAGCLAVALVLRILFLHRNLGRMLDAMSLAGCAGIAVGRLASFFDSSDRGPILASLQELPWAYPVTNPVSGQVEYRLAIFVFQAALAAALFVCVLVFYFFPRRKKKLPDGDVTLLILLVYCASQAIADSLRYDSLFFRSNGFVSLVQVISAVMVVLVAVIFSVRLVRKRGMRLWYFVFWVGMAGGLGLAGYMEYYVQRHGSEAAFGYSVMGGSLTAVVICVLAVYALCPLPLKKSAEEKHGKYLSKIHADSNNSVDTL